MSATASTTLHARRRRRRARRGGERAGASSEPFVLHVGSLEPRKGLDVLIEAAALAASEGAGWKRGPRRIPGFGGERIEAAARASGACDLLGPVSEEELLELMRAAGAFAAPALYEGFGIAPLEAMASGTPAVIAADSGGLEEISGPAAIVVGERSAAGLAESPRARPRPPPGADRTGAAPRGALPLAGGRRAGSKRAGGSGERAGSSPRIRRARRPVSQGPSKPEPSSTLRHLVIEDEAELAPYLEAWDALAVECRRPFCAPGWMLAWWQAARSGEARLRVIVVQDGDRVIGIGPFFAQVAYGLAEIRLLSAGFAHRLEPLARPGEEERVAAALAAALKGLEPAPASVVFESVDAESQWPELLAAAWPGRSPRLRTDEVMEAPVIELNGSEEAWMERRTRNFRKLARRTGKRIEEVGVKSRIGSDRAAVEALMHLHELRWQDRGGSGLDAEVAVGVLAGAAERLGPERFEVVLLEGEDGPISAELMLRTGPEAVLWATGFDPEWSRFAPGLQVRVVTLRAAAEHGVELVDLGGGGDEYKVRMADSDMPIAWRTLFPRGARYPLIRLRLAPKHARLALRRAVRRLPDERREQLRRLLRRG